MLTYMKTIIVIKFFPVIQGKSWLHPGASGAHPCITFLDEELNIKSTDKVVLM